MSMQITGEGLIFHVHFADRPIENKRDAMMADAGKQKEFSMGMIANGVILTPHHPGFICYSHTECEIDEVLNIAKQVLNTLNTMRK